MGLSIKPIRDRVLVKPESNEQKTKSGIIIPDTASKDRPTKGEVIAVGSGKLTDDGKVIPLTVKKGDKVYFSEYSGTEIKIEDVKYLIIKEEEILAVQ